ncbi:hypothetical protein CCUG62472_00003 [Mycobacteroides salmoniphilum]|nr:hypothetical protein CCUG62472_00003 [Mycobacteroides salmoniphilum]
MDAHAARGLPEERSPTRGTGASCYPSIVSSEGSAGGFAAGYSPSVSVQIDDDGCVVARAFAFAFLAVDVGVSDSFGEFG